MYLAPKAQKATGHNAIPVTLGALYARRTDARIPIDRIVQTSHAFHTCANAMEC